MIKLNNKTNIEFLEKAYEQFEVNKEIDLIISKNISNANFGITPSLIQFIATWYNNTKASKIIIDVKSDEELEEFYKLDFLFPSIVYCWDRKFVDSEGRDIKHLLKIQNEKKHTQMKFQEDGGGPKMLLSCFDHLPTSKGLLSAFYVDESFIENEFQFDIALSNTSIKVFTYIKQLHRLNFAKIHTEVIEIIYELMKNTHDWARTDIFYKPLMPNSRGLFMKLHKRKREFFSEAYESHKGLKDFFSQENFEANPLNELHFLEISVYDTGVGFVEKFEKKAINNFNTEEQVEIIKECLIENNTSATGIAKTYKGKGLDRIMKILNGKGFFWLRTGNVSIFRNLMKNNYKEGSNTKDIELFDWHTNSKDFTHLLNVKGSIITLVYPISNTSNV